MRAQTKMRVRIFAGLVLFFSLFWIYPNVIHEQTHLLALKLQGNDGTIAYDWTNYPSRPTITPTNELKTAPGAIFYYTAPSILAIGVVLLMWRFLKPSLGSVILGSYLSFEVLLNVLRSGVPASDFFWLPYAGATQALIYSIVLVVFVLNAITVSKFVRQHLNTSKVE
jgi:hypothetical protein